MSRSALLGFGLSVAVMVCSAQFAQAGFVPGFTGSSEFVKGPAGENPSFPDGLVNFAVYKNTGTTGNWVTDLSVTANDLPIEGIGAGVDTAAEYVFFYQLVNTNPLEGDDILNLLQISGGSLGTTAFSGGGFLTSGGTPLVFNESGAGGATGTLANPSLSTTKGAAIVAGDGTTTAQDQDLIPGNGIPGDGGASLASTPFVTDAAAVVSDLLKYTGSSNLYEFHTASILKVVTTAPAGLKYTAVLYLTSNSRPTYLPGRIHDGSFDTADIPSVTPEPGSAVAFFGTAICGLIALIVKQRKQTV